MGWLIWVLDGMAGRLMSGSSEVQRNIIAAMLGVGVQEVGSWLWSIKNDLS